MTLMHYDTNAKQCKNMSQECTKTKEGRVYKMTQKPMKSQKRRGSAEVKQAHEEFEGSSGQIRKASSKDPIEYHEKGIN